jgi:hypothetical protein
MANLNSFCIRDVLYNVLLNFVSRVGDTNSCIAL